MTVYIHALREEGDVTYPATYLYVSGFLSTPSARRATQRGPEVNLPMSDFYPRPPRGGRPSPKSTPTPRRPFLSTPSARRATFSDTVAAFSGRYFYPSPPRGGRRDQWVRLECLQRISIHALREEGDLACRIFILFGNYFYPRPPRGGRL